MENKQIIGIKHFLWLFFLITVSPVQASVTPDVAEQIIRDTSKTMLAEIRANREALNEEPGRIYPMISRVILPHFDFDRMSRLVIGRYWRRISEQQKESFTIEFEKLLLRTYATALLEYSDEVINVLPLRAAPDATRVTVRTEVQPAGGFAIPINYSLYLLDEQWKVYDLTIDGVSLIANYRNSFSARIRRDGIDNLLDKLAAKNAGVP